jgi:ABC-type nitrate/sulfonate/bicarbonate transport system permease component
VRSASETIGEVAGPGAAGGVSGAVRASLGRAARPVAFAVALALLWYVLGSTALLAPRGALPAPATVLADLGAEAGTARLWVDVAQTLETWAIGLAAAAAIAVVLGLAIGSLRLVYAAVKAPIELLRAVPSIAVLPLAVLVLGVHLRLAVVLVAAGAFWPLLIQMIYAVHNVDGAALEMGRVFRLGWLRRFGSIVLPSCLPYFFTGLRIAAVVALNVTIAVELLIGSTGGIGMRIDQLEVAGDIPHLYAYVAACGLLGLAINVATRRVERRVLRWHASQRSAVPA